MEAKSDTLSESESNKADTPWAYGLSAYKVFSCIPGSTRCQRIREICKSAEFISLQAVKSKSV